MRILLTDNDEELDVGSSDLLFALYSTIVSCLGTNNKNIGDAIAFLETRKCESSETLKTARQFNLIRDMLSQFKPDKAVYDINDKAKKGPWEGNLSPIVTSCANLFLTSEGKDLLFEIVAILTLGYYTNTSVIILE